MILKPDPGNPQELYLGSLAALGIDTRAHDIRFVEDNWESPVLGAWGLGWEVSYVIFIFNIIHKSYSEKQYFMDCSPPGISASGESQLGGTAASAGCLGP